MELKFDAANNPEGRKRVDFLIKNSKFFPHPDFPKQKDLRMYRVLLSMIDGSKKASQNTSSLDVHGGITKPESATALMEAHQKQEALSTQFTDDAIEGDASGTKIRKVRVVKVLTPDQELEKRAIDRLKKLDRRINGLKKKLKKLWSNCRACRTPRQLGWLLKFPSCSASMPLWRSMQLLSIVFL